MNISSLNETSFLNLPDWKKIELKKNRSNTNKFPLMTKEQENNRKYKIFVIASHFAGKDIDSLIESGESPIKYWPMFLQKIITPRLLDFVSIEEIIFMFGKCSNCSSYTSNLLGTHPLHERKKIRAIYGHCVVNIFGNKKEKELRIFVNPKGICGFWNPNNLSSSMIVQKIKSLFSKQEVYLYEDYLCDLKHIHFWDYFQDNYSIYYTLQNELEDI